MRILSMGGMEQINSMTKEELRMVCSNIQFYDQSMKTICITSTLPNAGKSFLSLNLAMIMAEGNQKVLFIDADMRNSYTWKRVGFEKELSGLCQVLDGKTDVDSAIYTTTNKNFFILPTGGTHKNPTILLRGEKFRDLLEELKEKYDYIIIDTPPVGLVTDASLVANACDGSALVIASGEDSSKNVKECIADLRKANDSFIGVILNKYEAKNDRSYGGYGRYGRYGKYGKGNYGTYGGVD